MDDILVTAIVSTYDADRFFHGCLEDLCRQSLGPRLEILVIDSASPGREGETVREFRERGARISYHRTPFRENSHAAFNRAIRLARGRYLTTANTDDRHRHDALELMAEVLENRPEFGLVYADSRITTEAGETFEKNSAELRYAWPDFNLLNALSCCLFGAQPLWRREVHAEVGFFDPSLDIAGDQDMFLRIAWKFGAVHLREDLGLFLKRGDSNSGENRRERALREVCAVLRRYRREIPLTDIFPGLGAEEGRDPHALAAACLEMGRLCALGPYNDLAAALEFHERAVRALPASHPEARNLTEICHHNLNLLFRFLEDARNGLPVDARGLPLRGLEHEVVREARRGKALRLASGRGFESVEEPGIPAWEAAFGGPDGVPLEAGRSGIECRSRGRPGEGRAAGPGPAGSSAAGSRGLRILQVMYGWDDSGGGTILPRRVAPALARRGHEVFVFTAEARPRPGLPPYGLHRREVEGVRVVGVANRESSFLDLGNPGREIGDPRIAEAFRGILDEAAPDLVHIWNLHNLGLELPFLAKERGIPVVFSPNNYWPICPRLYLFDPDGRLCDGPTTDGRACASCLGGEVGAPARAARIEAGRLCLRLGFDRILCVSSRVREIYARGGADPRALTVLHQEPPLVEECHTRAALGRRVPSSFSEPRPLRVGYIGSLLPHKGVHVLVEAAQRVEGPLEIRIAGEGPEMYRRRLEALDGKGRVRFEGAYLQEDLPRVLAGMDLVAVPSLWEDCAPFTTSEALASGAPVLGAAIGGIPDFVLHGVNGFLHAPGNQTELASQLRSLLEDPALFARLVSALPAPRGFGAFVADLEEVYDTLVGEGPKRRFQASEPLRT